MIRCLLILRLSRKDIAVFGALCRAWKWGLEIERSSGLFGSAAGAARHAKKDQESSMRKIVRVGRKVRSMPMRKVNMATVHV